MGKEMSKILPGIYVGRLDNAQNDKDMMANCITHVLSVHEPVKQKLVKSNSYKYFEVNVKDDETAIISKYFQKTNDFIHLARVSNGNVLVHCLAGVSRAPTVAVAYLMTVYDLSFQDAFNCLRCVRPNVKPNNGFMRQLMEFGELDKVTERERLFKEFGVWKNIEEDQKIIQDLIDQYESQEMDESIESSIGDQPSSPFLLSYGSEGYFYQNPRGLTGDGTDPLESALVSGMSRLNRCNVDSPTNLEVDSDVDDDADIPGSIPIGGIHRETIQTPANGTADFRGRAYSRQPLPVTTDENIYTLNQYGNTAPPSIPIFYGNVNK